ncbi:MAG TPA: hypothetical protein VNN99_19640 [Vicinamibacterales bacterium]|jgi:hypothetical protein|nr:hypothetical protein [Vicinamibacterales bacterium]
MKRWMATCAFAAAIAATAHAQDSTVTTRTQVKADDAKAITATGCLVPGLAPGAFALRGGITARGEEVTSKTQTKTEVDSDEARVRTETRTKAEGDHNRVNHGAALLYDLSPRAGVDLTPHIGQQVQLTAIVLDRGKGDADVKIKEETNVDREHGKDGKSTTESKITVDRGNGPRLNVISVKSLGQPCT